jgi:hypothetical protein
MRHWKCLAFSILALSLALTSGCSGDSGQFGTVSGTVTHNGVPVEGAKVEFHGTTEIQGGARDMFAATTDSNGKYMIAGVGKLPGIPPGMYQVAISKYNSKGFVTGEGMDQGQLDAISSDQGPKAAGLKNLLPKQYAIPGSSKLSAQIQAGKNENVSFDLTGN